MTGDFSFFDAFNPIVLLFSVNFAVFMVVGSYVFLLDPRSGRNIAFLAWNLSFSLGCLGYGFVFWTTNKKGFYVFAMFSGLAASRDFIRTEHGWVNVPSDNILYPVYLVYLFSGIAISIALVVWVWIFARRSGNFSKAKQAKIMLSGAIPSIVLGIFVNVVAPIVGLRIPSIGFAFSGLWIAGMA